MALVEGEAGIGKTRLVSEALGSSALLRHRKLVGYCHLARVAFPLGPFVEALCGLQGSLASVSFNPIVGALRPLLPELASQLPPLPVMFGGSEMERHRIFRAFREALVALGPTVVVLEDLHWIDPETVELIEFLVTDPPPSLALILTYRREELEAGAPVLALAARVCSDICRQTVALSALDREQVHDLARAILAPGEVSPPLAESLYAWTAGIPFTLEEIIWLLRDRGQLVFREGRWNRDDLDPPGVPPALAGALRHRLASLGADAERLTEAAAVLSTPAAEGLLGEVAGLPRPRSRAALSRTLTAGVLHEIADDRVDFRHILARQAVYEAIPTPDRRALHLRAARGIMAGEELSSQAQAAHHFRQAGESRLWLRCTEQAADAASSVGDDRGAARLLEDALSTSGLSLAVRARMAVKLGGAALFGRVPERAIGILRELVAEESLRPGIRGELRFCLARLLYQVGERTSGYREMVRAAGELSRRPALAAYAMANLAATWPTEGGAQEDRAWLARALAAEGRQKDPVVSTQVLTARAVLLLDAGDPAGWRTVDEIPWSARSAGQAAELVCACKYLAASATLLGYYARAEALLERGHRIRKEMGNERFGVGLASVEIELRWRTGRWEGLEACARQLARASVEAPIMSARSELIVGWLLMSRGELGEAERRLDAVMSALHNARPGSSLLTGAGGLIRIHLARGDIDAAHTVALLALQTIRAGDIWTLSQAVAPAIVEALLAGGRLPAASKVATELSRALRGRDSPAGRAALAACRGLLAEAEGRSETAARWFARSERAWSRLPGRYEAALARERRGRCLLVGQDSAGGDLLLDALQDYEALGATWDSARARALLRTHSVALPYPWRGGRRHYRWELSPREREVVELASLGRTSPEIARALFLSARTVESHIASAMRKLGVASRRELALAPQTKRPSRQVGQETKIP